MATQSQPSELSSTTIDPYETLGLTHDATSTQIKIAYRKLALKYHPDRCQSPTQQNSTQNSSAQDDNSQQQSSSANTVKGIDNNKNEETILQEATDKFARIAAAYATLSDTTKKKEYDHLYKLGAFDNNSNNDSVSGKNHTTSTPQTNNYRYTENLSGGYYKPGYKPPPQSTNTSTHPFSNMAANFTPAQQQSFAKQAEAAFTSMQSQDSFFDDLLYSPKSNIAQQHEENKTTKSAANGDTTNNNSKTNHSSTTTQQKKKKQTGIGYSFKPIGKHLSIHVPSRNEIMLNMTQAQMSNMMNNNNDKSDDSIGGIAQGAEKHLFGTRVTFSENKTTGMSSLANIATCGLATSCIPSSTCGADTSSSSNNNDNNGVKSTGKEKKVISTTTRIAKGKKRIVKRTAHLYPNGTKEIVIEENGVVVRRYVEENPHAVNNTTNGDGTNAMGGNGENGSGESKRDDNETTTLKTPPRPKSKEEEEEEDEKTSSGGLQKEDGKFTLLGLFKACYSPCSATSG